VITTEALAVNGGTNLAVEAFRPRILLMASSLLLVTFAFGYLPTKVPHTSQRLMNLVSLFGAGLLVGAALIVIVPEGMSVLYESF
jgi:zinc transporter 9